MNGDSYRLTQSRTRAASRHLTQSAQPIPDRTRRTQVADFYADRSGLIPPLPWQTSALPFSGDRDEAIVLKMAENFFRNDLSVIDRAVFVQTYRDAWEQKYGEINPKGRSPLH